MNSSGTIQLVVGIYKGFISFPPGDISSKVNLIVRLEFEIVYYNVAVQLLATTLKGLPKNLIR